MAKGCSKCCKKGVDVETPKTDDGPSPSPSQTSSGFRQHSLTKLLGGGNRRNSQESERTPRDDPDTHYGTAVDGATDAKAEKRFNPNLFKKRVGDHLAAMAALGGERQPLIDASEEDELDEADVERAARRKKREERRKHKDEVKARAAELRATQRRCWIVLVLLVVVLIVAVGMLFGDVREHVSGIWPAESQNASLSTNESSNASNVTVSTTQTTRPAFGSPAREVKDTDDWNDAYGDDSDEIAEAGISRVDGEDASTSENFDIEWNDPRVRTISPKAWRRHERELEKLKRDARRNAKGDVERWVEGAHRVAGVGANPLEDEEDYVDRSVERVETSPGLIVERRRRGKDVDGTADASDVLRQSQVSILSHGLIADTANSAQMLKTMTKQDAEVRGDKSEEPTDTAAAGRAERIPAALPEVESRTDDAEAKEDFGMSQLFRSRDEPVVHERQPDPESTFSLAPRRALG
ncbi:unnamed product [Ostreococcus tauri]|uniref:Unnamed product n=1 Tax=Ostreococcus tauri TaxID=70448 RepID=A0A090MEK4_OSTTA|nr:unnamed product [Ostreococcus tauri]CEG01397.1 unnamed product [Ostreococcus tauri]|eukprot:XP_003080677.2 unnamed product [Ostreococcus tauri]